MKIVSSKKKNLFCINEVDNVQYDKFLIDLIIMHTDAGYVVVGQKYHDQSTQRNYLKPLNNSQVRICKSRGMKADDQLVRAVGEICLKLWPSTNRIPTEPTKPRNTTI